MNLKQIILVGLTAIVAVVMTRSLSPSAQAAVGVGGKPDILVLGQSVTIPQDQLHAYLVILDRDTMEVWAYREYSATPISMGKLQMGHKH